MRKKIFLIFVLIIFAKIVFAEGYGTSSYETQNPAIYPPYDIGKCRNMIGRALAAKFDLAKNNDYSETSLQKALLLTGLTKKQAEITVKYCPKLVEFWNADEIWKNKQLLDDPSSLYFLVLSAQESSFTTQANTVYADMILDLYD